MADRDHHLARQHLLVGERLLDRVHGRDRHLPAQALEPLGRGVAQEFRAQDRAERVAVGQTVGEGTEARVLAQPGEPHALDQPLPELLLHAHDDDPAVARLEALAGDEALVRALREALRAPLAVERPDGHVVQHRDRRVEERDVEVAADTGRVRPVEPDHERQRGEDAAREVDDRHAALGGRCVGLARDAHEARVGLEEVVVARVGGARTGAAEAGERTADDLRVHGRERGVVEAELPRQIAAHVVVDGVHARDQAMEQVAALGRAEIQRDAARAAVERLVVEAVAPGRVVEGRHGARLVAARGRVLHLDDLGAQVGEKHEAVRPRPELREGEDADAVERERAVDTHGAMLLHSPRPFNRRRPHERERGILMSTPGAFRDVIKRGREERALPVGEFLAGLDRFIAEHNPYSQSKVIPAIGSGQASFEVVKRYAKTLYEGLYRHYGVRVKDLEVHAYAEQEHGDKALELMQRVCTSAHTQRRVRQAVEHTILTNEWRTWALNRWLDEPGALDGPTRR